MTPNRTLDGVLGRIQDFYAYLRSNLSQNGMNRPTENVVAPGLIIVSERFIGKCGDTRSEAIVLGIGAHTTLLDSTAKCLYSRCLGLNIRGEIDPPCVQGGPPSEVWNPCIVLQYCAILIESPIGDLNIGLLALANSSAGRELDPTAGRNL